MEHAEDRAIRPVPLTAGSYGGKPDDRAEQAAFACRKSVSQDESPDGAHRCEEDLRPDPNRGDEGFAERESEDNVPRWRSIDVEDDRQLALREQGHE